MDRGDKVGYERMWYHIRYGNGIEGNGEKKKKKPNPNKWDETPEERNTIKRGSYFIMSSLWRKTEFRKRVMQEVQCKYPSWFYSSETGTNCIQCKSEEESALIFSQIPTENGKEEMHLFAMPSFDHSKKRWITNSVRTGNPAVQQLFKYRDYRMRKKNCNEFYKCFKHFFIFLKRKYTFIVQLKY